MHYDCLVPYDDKHGHLVSFERTIIYRIVSYHLELESFGKASITRLVVNQTIIMSNLSEAPGNLPRDYRPLPAAFAVDAARCGMVPFIRQSRCELFLPIYCA